MTPVDRLYSEANQVIEQLEDLSLQISASDYFRKCLLLAAASYFEHRITESLLEHVGELSQNSSMVIGIIKTKAIKKQYHTWFDWDNKKINPFSAMLGDEFKQYIGLKINASTDLKEGIDAFLEIGAERNKLAHQDFASFAMEKTMQEVYSLYKKANSFIELLPGFYHCQD